MNLKFGFEPIESFTIDGMSAEQHVFRFGNGYGASIVRGSYTYGGLVGLWELAVIRWHNRDWCLDYGTALGDDVIGWLTDDDVTDYLHRISLLPNVVGTV